MPISIFISSLLMASELACYSASRSVRHQTADQSYYEEKHENA